MKKLFIVLLLIGGSAFGTEYKGTATAATEIQALERAWTNAVIQMALAEHPETVDVKSQSTESLRKSDSERSILIDLENMDLSSVKEVSSTVTETDGKFTAVKVLSGGLKVKSKRAKPGEIEPYRYAKSLGKPKVYKGMSKAELLMKFGKPEDVNDNYDGRLQIVYSSRRFCDYDMCFVYTNKDGVVSSFTNFNHEYTDLLK